VRVGVAGLGRMGAVLAHRLLDAGHEVSVWNRSAGPVAELTERGAAAAGSPADLATAVDVVVVLVHDDAAVRRVWLAGDGLLAGAVAGTLLVESSTVRVDTVRQVAAAAAAVGAAVVDAPVSGTAGPVSCSAWPAGRPRTSPGPPRCSTCGAAGWCIWARWVPGWRPSSP